MPFPDPGLEIGRKQYICFPTLFWNIWHNCCNKGDSINKENCGIVCRTKKRSPIFSLFHNRKTGK